TRRFRQFWIACGLRIRAAFAVRDKTGDGRGKERACINDGAALCGLSWISVLRRHAYGVKAASSRRTPKGTSQRLRSLALKVSSAERVCAPRPFRSGGEREWCAARSSPRRESRRLRQRWSASRR